MVSLEMLGRLDSKASAEFLSQLHDPLLCARNSGNAISSSESDQSCVSGTLRQALVADSVSAALPVLKSLKRRRAESALAAQYASSNSKAIHSFQCKRQKANSAEAITVAACTLASCRCGGRAACTLAC